MTSGSLGPLPAGYRDKEEVLNSYRYTSVGKVKTDKQAREENEIRVGEEEEDY